MREGWLGGDDDGEGEEMEVAVAVELRAEAGAEVGVGVGVEVEVESKADHLVLKVFELSILRANGAGFFGKISDKRMLTQCSWAVDRYLHVA